MKQRSGLTVLILSFLTCGLYGIYWMYAAKTEFNDFIGRKNGSPALEVLASVLCFIYFWYWLFQFSQEVYNEGVARGKRLSDNSMICLIVSLLGFPQVAFLLIQDDMNLLAQDNEKNQRS